VLYQVFNFAIFKTSMSPSVLRRSLELVESLDGKVAHYGSGQK